jgi:hypothetical protein
MAANAAATRGPSVSFSCVNPRSRRPVSRAARERPESDFAEAPRRSWWHPTGGGTRLGVWTRSAAQSTPPREGPNTLYVLRRGDSGQVGGARKEGREQAHRGAVVGDGGDGAACEGEAYDVQSGELGALLTARPHRPSAMSDSANITGYKPARSAPCSPGRSASGLHRFFLAVGSGRTPSSRTMVTAGAEQNARMRGPMPPRPHHVRRRGWWVRQVISAKGDLLSSLAVSTGSRAHDVRSRPDMMASYPRRCEAPRQGTQDGRRRRAGCGTAGHAWPAG